MEEVQYEVTEGGVVEICVLSEGELDSTFTALVQSNDLTAQGQYKCLIYHSKQVQTFTFLV